MGERSFEPAEFDEEFGEDRLIATLQRNSAIPPQAILSAVVRQLPAGTMTLSPPK